MGSLAGFVMALAWLRLAVGATWEEMGWRAYQWPAQVLLGVVTFLVVMIPIFGLQALLNFLYEQLRGEPRQHPLIEHLRDHPGGSAFLIAAFTAVGRPILDAAGPDHVLFSFHGLPVRHLVDQDRELGHAHCLASPDCCARLTEVNRRCYRAQSFATALSQMKMMQMPKEKMNALRDGVGEKLTKAGKRDIAKLWMDESQNLIR